MVCGGRVCGIAVAAMVMIAFGWDCDCGQNHVVKNTVDDKPVDMDAVKRAIEVVIHTHDFSMVGLSA